MALARRAIVHAMAPKDEARARRVADRMNQYPEELRNLPFHHAFALKMMDLALAASCLAKVPQPLMGADWKQGVPWGILGSHQIKSEL